MEIATDSLNAFGELFLAEDPRNIIERRSRLRGKSGANAEQLSQLQLDFDSYKDLAAAFSVCSDAKTIIFPATLMRSFMDMSFGGKIKHTKELDLPFPHTVIQCTEKILEQEFFPDVEPFMSDMNVIDSVLILSLSNDEFPTDGRMLNSVICWYTPSMSVNRVAWWEDNGQYNIDPGRKISENKKHLRSIGTAIAMYLNSRNVRINRKEPHPKVNKKRRKRGKRELPTYYETRIIKTFTASSGAKRIGSAHSFMYPVRGHFRHFKNGERVWVPPHYRGVEHGVKSMPKHAYRVKHDEERS